MKYKVLVTGNNASVIDSFFHQMENNFEALTTSIRYADIIRHMNCYEPDAFVYCLHNEPRDHIMQMASVKYKLAQEDIPFILLGSKEECDEFEKMAVNVADLILYRPLSAEAIQERILKFFKGKKPRKESGAQNDAAKENTGLGDVCDRKCIRNRECARRAARNAPYGRRAFLWAKCRAGIIGFAAETYSCSR